MLETLADFWPEFLAAGSIIILAIIVWDAGRRSRKSGFVPSFFYSPSCGTDRAGRRRNDCRGFTTGTMPSIETVTGLGNGLCGGILGVPI